MLTRLIMATAGLITPQIGRSITLMHAADEAPLYAMLLDQWDGKYGEDTKQQWKSRAMDGRYNQVNSGALDAASTVIPVDSSTPFYVDAIIRSDATGEMMRVTAVGSGTQITVSRAWGAADGAPAAHANSVADDVVLRVIGGARAEGADTPAMRQNAPSDGYNYSQIYRKSVKQTGTADSTTTITDDEFNSQKAHQLSELHRDIEYSFLFGRKSLTTVGSDVIGTVGGIENEIVTNVDNVGGTMTRARMRTAFNKAWSIGGSSVKIAFAGETASGAVNEIFENKLQTRSGERMPGLIVQEVECDRGKILLVRHRLMRPKNIIVVDPGHVQLRPKQDEKSTGQPRGLPHERVKRQGPGVDGRTDEFMADLNVIWGPEAFHALITNIDGAA